MVDILVRRLIQQSRWDLQAAGGLQPKENPFFLFFILLNR